MGYMRELLVVLLLSLCLFQVKGEEEVENNTSARSVERAVINPDCAEQNNLGDGYSEATGTNVYSSSCFPRVTGFPGGYPRHGYDDSVAVFVGGNFNAQRGAEVEGNVVVLGNLQVDNQGPSNFVSVGAGTHVLPNSGGDCIIVGGNLKAYRDIQTFNLRGSMSCDIVYRGSGTNTYRWKTNGRVRSVPSYDMSAYEAMKEAFLLKSKFWGGLPATAHVAEQYTTTLFTCTNSNEVQVFNINKGDRTITASTSYQFTNSCNGKTILINVKGTGSIGVNAAAFYDYRGSQSAFSSCQAQSMLWNFPEADNVDIGNGKTSEFYGSVLVAGNLKFTTSGHSGRTIVCGDLTHYGWGSEFHSFPFKPPTRMPCEPHPVPVNGTSEMTHGLDESFGW